MDFINAMNYIHSLNRFGSKPGLERISALLCILGNPQNRLKFIHVAGTNGKGSTCTMLSSILIQAGFKTGLFISPYVVDFRERIQINGKFISQTDLSRLAERVKSAAEIVAKNVDQPTEFEFITALAMCYYAESNCDIVVLETGLGGRLDSTNIISTPAISVITKIGLDHTVVLGDTIEKIAFEKCSIIKPGCSVVAAPNQPKEALKIIAKTAEKLNCQLIVPDINNLRVIKTTPFLNTFIYKHMQINMPLPGAHQIENAITAIEAAILYGIKQQDIIMALSTVSFPARLEIISKDPLVILDGAHNPDGAAVLAEYIKHLAGPPVAIIGMMADKDIKKSLSIIAPLCKSIIAVTVASNPRSSTAKEVAAAATEFCSSVYMADNYVSALKLADSVPDKSAVIICGSLYLASDIRNLAKKRYNNSGFDN